LAGIGLAKCSREVTHAVRAAHCLCERARLQHIAAMQYRAAAAQLIDQRLLTCRFRAIQTYDRMTGVQCTLNEMSANESRRTRHKKPHMVAYLACTAALLFLLAAELPPK
jgi:hypothetical protein